MLSKNRKLSGNTFVCRTKATCSVNLTAGKARKDTVYLWDFGNGTTFWGPNPLSRKFGFGSYAVTLKIFDTKTGDIREEAFRIVIERLVAVKKAEKPKALHEKVEKPLTVK